MEDSEVGVSKLITHRKSIGWRVSFKLEER
jgi:hypothetical protein